MIRHGWPLCTGGPGCDHEQTNYETEEALLAFARQHKDEYVNRNGYAVCVCHATLAPHYGVRPFECDQFREAAS